MESVGSNETVRSIQCIGMIYESEIAAFDLSGYIPAGKATILPLNGKKYAVQKYQGIHKDEYTVMEMKNNVPNGTAQLFRKGLIQLSWKMVDGKREGNLTVYDEKGVVFGITTWESLQEAMTTGINRVIVNDRSGKRLLVERCIQNGVITYKGGYHKFTMHKEGYGIEYYLESGYEKSVGFYRDDKLIHIYQSFEKNKDGEWLMTEYDGDENMNNVDEVLNCHPIYVGKYRFDEKRLIFIRSGCGYKINICTGICDCLVDYDENGDEVEESQTELFGGWYSEGKCNLSIRVSELERVEREEMPFWNEIINVCPGLKLSYTRGIEELVIEDYQKNDGCSDNSDMKLNVSGFVRLNKIVIGKMCFKNVREFVLEGLMSLEKVVVGEKCFRISEYEREDGLLRISNCPNLCHLEIGDRSFEDYKQFELSNVNSLHTIQFGEQCFRHIEDFILKDLSSLYQVTFKSYSFQRCHHAKFENLPALTTIIFDGEQALAGYCENNRITNINGHESYDNILEMKNLPSLTNIQCLHYGGIHHYFGRVILENIPNLIHNNIDYGYGYNSFSYTADVQAIDAKDLEDYVKNKSKYL